MGHMDESTCKHAHSYTFKLSIFLHWVIKSTSTYKREYRIINASHWNTHQCIMHYCSWKSWRILDFYVSSSVESRMTRSSKVGQVDFKTTLTSSVDFSEDDVLIDKTVSSVGVQISNKVRANCENKSDFKFLVIFFQLNK